jgi:hypothetical protein
MVNATRWYVQEVHRPNAGGTLYNAVSRHGYEAMATPTHSREVAQAEVDRLNGKLPTHLKDQLYAAVGPELATALRELRSSAMAYRESVGRRRDGTASNEAVNMLSATLLLAQRTLDKLPE